MTVATRMERDTDAGAKPKGIFFIIKGDVEERHQTVTFVHWLSSHFKALLSNRSSVLKNPIVKILLITLFSDERKGK